MIKVGNKYVGWREGMTMAQLLADLGDERRYPAARVNGETILSADFQKTFIPDDAEVYLLPMMAGG